MTNKTSLCLLFLVILYETIFKCANNICFGQASLNCLFTYSEVDFQEMAFSLKNIKGSFNTKWLPTKFDASQGKKSHFNKS